MEEHARNWKPITLARVRKISMDVTARSTPKRARNRLARTAHLALTTLMGTIVFAVMVGVGLIAILRKTNAKAALA